MNFFRQLGGAILGRRLWRHRARRGERSGGESVEEGSRAMPRRAAPISPSCSAWSLPRRPSASPERSSPRAHGGKAAARHAPRRRRAVEPHEQRTKPEQVFQTCLHFDLKHSWPWPRKTAQREAPSRLMAQLSDGVSWMSRPRRSRAPSGAVAPRRVMFAYIDLMACDAVVNEQERQERMHEGRAGGANNRASIGTSPRRNALRRSRPTAWGNDR